MFIRLVVIILLLSFVFVNCFAVVAYADLWDGLKYTITSLWDGSFFMDPAGATVNYWKALFGIEDAESYDAYVAENYPVNVYASDGSLYFLLGFSDCTMFFSVDPVLFSNGHLDRGSYYIDLLAESFGYMSFRGYSTARYSVGAVFEFHSISPFDGVLQLIQYSPRYSMSLNGQSSDSVSVSKGDEITFKGTYRFDTPLYASFSLAFYFPLFKVTLAQSIDTNIYVHNTRVGSVNFNLATKQGDTVTNVYQDVTIVNENTNVYTDPTTGEQKNINSWTYDYSTRTYHLTLEDGSSLDVEFGDDSIKVKLNGEITQEYYYTVENEPEPTPSPEPSPIPTPGGGDVDPTPTPGGGEEPPPTATPEPTPDPGTGGEDEPPDGFFEWLKQWLIDFKEWLGDWLDKLLHKEPGDITIDESDNSVHVEDNDSVDYDIYYTDDQGEQQQTSLRNILHKFGFLHDIYDLGRDMFTIVGADAAAAYAYDPGGTIDITPYLGDLRTVAAEDIMPIAGAPSLKMDLGAAQSHYGYEYGGEVEFLDLSWYTPYKQTVDSLLSGFLWLMFIWRLFKVAPGIISGAGMVTDKAEDIHDGKRH